MHSIGAKESKQRVKDVYSIILVKICDNVRTNFIIKMKVTYEANHKKNNYSSH